MNYCSQCGHELAVKIPVGDHLPRHVCEHCGTIHYQNPKLVVGCICEWDGGVLLCRRAIEPRAGFWTLPDGRTLRVARQPHPLGGLLLLFSDVTDELRLRAQYNALIKVQQATLDKLNDAVAVFGCDGRLRLRN